MIGGLVGLPVTVTTTGGLVVLPSFVSVIVHVVLSRNAVNLERVRRLRVDYEGIQRRATAGDVDLDLALESRGWTLDDLVDNQRRWREEMRGRVDRRGQRATRGQNELLVFISAVYR